MTTSRNRTTAALCAAAIRKELKAAGIKAQVRSSNFSMGDSVTVTIAGEYPPGAVAAITAELSKYQYGHFDGMQDLYEYSNRRDDIPQTKFLTVEFDYPPDLKQAAYNHLRNLFWKREDLEHVPADYATAQLCYVDGEMVAQAVWDVLNGNLDQRCASPRLKFWPQRLPRVRLQAA